MLGLSAMDVQTQLLAAIAALWGLVTTGGGGVIRWLVEDRKALKAEWSQRLETERAECRQEISRRDAKLDGAADLTMRQAEAMQRQIDTQAQMIVALQAALAKGQAS